jgi:hypothetical protein
MAIAVEVTFRGHGATIENYKKGLTLLGTAPGGRHPDPRCLFHWATEEGGGVTVTDVWETKEAFDTFAAEKLGPTLPQTGLPDPHTKFINVANFLTA